jgi:hypothetical protein
MPGLLDDVFGAPLIDNIFGKPSARRQEEGPSLMRALGMRTDDSGATETRAGVQVKSAAEYLRDLDISPTESRLRQIRAERAAKRDLEERTLKPDGTLEYYYEFLSRGFQSNISGLDRVAASIADELGANEFADKHRRYAEIREHKASRPIEGETSGDELWEKPSFSGVANFIAEQGIQSTPDMVVAIGALPAYVASLAGRGGQQRAENSGRDEATLGDIVKALPTSVVSAFLDRLPLMAIFKGKLGSTVGGRIAGGAAAEGGTEFVQSGIEYAGETVGTEKGFDSHEAIKQSILGAVAGTGIGGAIATGAEGVRATAGVIAPGPVVDPAYTADVNRAAVDALSPDLPPQPAFAVEIPDPADLLSESDRRSPIPNDILAAGRKVLAETGQPRRQAPPRRPDDAPTTGSAIEGYLDRTRAAESGGDPTATNPKSTATGAYQFTEGTWLDIYRRHRTRDAAGKNAAQILALRNNPIISRQMAAILAQENGAALVRNGHRVDNGTLYLSHFLGSGGANSVLSARPDAPVEALLEPGQVKANKEVLKGKTAAQVIAWAYGKMGAAANEVPVASLNEGANEQTAPERERESVEAFIQRILGEEEIDLREAARENEAAEPDTVERRAGELDAAKITDPTELVIPDLPPPTESSIAASTPLPAAAPPVAAPESPRRLEMPVSVTPEARLDVPAPAPSLDTGGAAAVPVAAVEPIAAPAPAVALGGGPVPQVEVERPIAPVASADGNVPDIRAAVEQAAKISPEAALTTEAANVVPNLPPEIVRSIGSKLTTNYDDVRLEPVEVEALRAAGAVSDIAGAPLHGIFKATILNDHLANERSGAYQEVPARTSVAPQRALEEGAPRSVPAPPPNPNFDPEPLVAPLRQYVERRGASLDPQAIAKNLGVTPGEALQVVGSLASRPDSGLFVSQKGNIRRVPVRTSPTDVVTFLRDRGGLRNDAGHDLRNVGGIARHPGLINRNGLSLDEAGEALHDAGYIGPDRPTEADVLDLVSRASTTRIYNPNDMAAVLDRQGAVAQKELERRASDMLDDALADYRAMGVPLLLSKADRDGIAAFTQPDHEDSHIAIDSYFREKAASIAQDAFDATNDPDYDIPFAQDAPYDHSIDPFPDLPEPSAGDAQGGGRLESFARDEGGGEAVGAEARPAGEIRAIEGDGGQLDAFGLQAGDERRALERQADGRLQSDKQQKPPGSDGGLFDAIFGPQGDIGEVAREARSHEAQVGGDRIETVESMARAWDERAGAPADNQTDNPESRALDIAMDLLRRGKTTNGTGDGYRYAFDNIMLTPPREPGKEAGRFRGDNINVEVQTPEGPRVFSFKRSRVEGAISSAERRREFEEHPARDLHKDGSHQAFKLDKQPASKHGHPLADVRVGQGADGKFYSDYAVHTPGAGTASPFTHSDPFDTRDAALDRAFARALKTAEGIKRNPTSGKDASEADRVIEWVKAQRAKLNVTSSENRNMEDGDVSGGRPDLERDREGAGASDAIREKALLAGRGGVDDGSGGGEPEAGGERGGRPSGEGGLPDDGAAPVGEPSGSGVRGEASADAAGTEGRGGPVGSGPDGIAGLPAEHIPAGTLAEAARDRPGIEAKRDAQFRANAIPVKLGNVAETLPFLHAAQHEDVAFIEERFDRARSGEVPPGVLLTNATGTGKTFVGAGAIARAVRSGKAEHLVLAPSQDILSSWKAALAELGVESTILEGIEDAGKGVSLTTFANFTQNFPLQERDLDRVTVDEAHKLTSNKAGEETGALTAFRAITNHPRGRWQRAKNRLREQWAEVDAFPVDGMSEAQKDKRNALIRRTDELAKSFDSEPRAEAVMLSATPFAYVETVDYAEGFLFDYPPDPPGGGMSYNQPNGQQRFFIQHFGYRMRNNRLTKPEAGVDSDIMEREFHEYLRRERSLSGRILDVEADYDRKFFLVDDAVGNQIDKALDFLANADNGKFRHVHDAVMKNFDFLSRMRLLEAIKAHHAIPMIRAYHKAGRKVVVFHDYNEGGGFNPFALEFDTEQTITRYTAQGTKTIKPHDLMQEFLARNPYVTKLNFKRFKAPLVTLAKAFPDALIYNGTVPPKKRRQAREAFNQDGPDAPNLIIIQSAAGEAGISAHDVTGKHRRVSIDLAMTVRAVSTIQKEGRTYRDGQVTDASFRYLNTGTAWERMTFAGKIAERAGTAENLALGNMSRALRQSIIDSYNDSQPFSLGEDDGKGGKAHDRALYTMTPFDRAKTHYWAQQKARGRRDQREGLDYFATPEPIGFKMVEWADLRNKERILEPSAGHGAIARFFPETADRTLIEPSVALLSRAALASPGAKTLDHRFEDLNIVNKFDAIVMNPPFGLGGKTAIEHLDKASSHVRDGGRIVALLPTGLAADKRFDAWFESDRAKGLHIVSSITLPAVTFERAGTSVRARVVVLERQNSALKAQAIQQRNIDLTSAETVKDLFDRIENIEMPERLGGAIALPPRSVPAAVRESAKQFTIWDYANGEKDTGPPVRGDSDAVPSRRGGAFRGLAIAENLRTEKATALVGASAASPHELAALAQVYRDPRFETLRVFFTKGDEIIHATGVSARLPGSAPLLPGPEADAFERWVEWLRDTIVSSGANGYYLVHNHPSGNPEPSRDDITVTRAVAQRVRGFRGHVVINSNRYATIESTGLPRIHEKNFGEDRLLKAAQPHPVLGMQIDATSKLAPVAKMLQRPEHITVIAADTRWNVRALVDFPLAELDRPKLTLLGTLRRIMRQSGSTGLHLVGPKEAMEHPNVIEAVARGVITETVDENQDFSRAIRRGESSVLEKPGGGRFVAEGGEGFDFDASQPRRGMTERQRAELAARQQQGMARRGGQKGVGDQDGGLFAAERDQGSLFRVTRGEGPVIDPKTIDRLRAELKKLNLADKIVVDLVDRIVAEGLPEGAQVAGNYRAGLLQIALSAPQNAVETLNHEAIHALRDMGLFRDAEWRSLERRAQADAKLMERLSKDYEGQSLTDEQLLEEAVAEMYRAWRGGRLESGFVRAGLQRINELFAALRRVFTRAGTAEDVMRAIERGEVGGRRGFTGESSEGIADDSAAVKDERVRYSIIGTDPSEPDPGTVSKIAKSVRDLIGDGNIDKVREGYERWRTRLQDRMLPLLRTQERIALKTGPLAEEMNPYLAEELMSGKVGANLEKLGDDMVAPLFEQMKAEGVSIGELESYLYARHAPERNARIGEINPEFRDGGGSGMTDAEAADIMAEVERAGKTKALERVAAKVDAILAFAVDTRVESGLLSADEAEAWRSQYQAYVPLRGQAEVNPEDGSAVRVRAGSGINVRGPESQRAFGRKSQADHILAYSILQAEEAIVRAGMNDVAQRFHELAKANPDPEFWKVDKIARKPWFNKQTGQVEYRVTDRLAAEDAPYTVSLKIAGQEHRVTMNRKNRAAVRLAESMRNLDGVQLTGVIRTLSSINRFLSAINTTFNPEFVITNAFRDIQTAGINMREFDQRGLISGTLKDYPSALKASVKGAFKKGEGEWKDWYDEFVGEGGRVFFNRVEDLNEIQKRIEKQFRNAAGGLGAARSGAAALFKYIDQANTGVENAVRLAAYKNARQGGMSKAQAASLAKNLTVNFNRRGSWGPAMNALYLFYNASIQGSVRMLGAMKSKRVRRFLYIAIATGAVLELLNGLISEDDDDGESFYDKISEHDKSRNLIVMIPGGGGKHIKIPLPYGYNTFFAMGRAGMEVAKGRRWQESGGNLLSTIVDSFNPIGGTESFLNFVAPTIADPVVELERNRDFADRPIMPDANPFESPPPDSQRYWASISPHWRVVTDLLNSASGGDTVVPGYIDVSPETLEHLSGFVTGAAGSFFVDRMGGLVEKAAAGEAIEANDLPLVRKVVGGKPGWYDRAAYRARINEVEEAASRLKEYGDKGQEDAALDFETENAELLELAPAMKTAQRVMRRARKERGKLEQQLGMGEIDKAMFNDLDADLKEQEEEARAEFNAEYLALVEKPKRP